MSRPRSLFHIEHTFLTSTRPCASTGADDASAAAHRPARAVKVNVLHHHVFFKQLVVDADGLSRRYVTHCCEIHGEVVGDAHRAQRVAAAAALTLAQRAAASQRAESSALPVRQEVVQVVRRQASAVKPLRQVLAVAHLSTPSRRQPPQLQDSLYRTSAPG